MTPADIVTKLVDELTDKVLATLGAGHTEPVGKDGARHVLKLKMSKVVAEHLQRVAAGRV